jgi:hypothetical protein
VEESNTNRQSRFSGVGKTYARRPIASPIASNELVFRGVASRPRGGGFFTASSRGVGDFAMAQALVGL